MRNKGNELLEGEMAAGADRRGNIHIHKGKKKRPFLHYEHGREPQASLTIHSHYTAEQKYSSW